MKKIAVFVIAVLVVAGCGTDKAAQEKQAAVAHQREVEQARVERKQKAYEECKGHSESFLNRLQDLGSRLDVGLNYEDYFRQVAA